MVVASDGVTAGCMCLLSAKHGVTAAAAGCVLLFPSFFQDVSDEAEVFLAPWLLRIL